MLVITDHFPKYTKTFALPDQKAATIAEVLVNKWFHVHGEPQKIHSDQGTIFNSELINQACALYNITKTRNSPYHPQAAFMVRFRDSL